MRLRKSLIVKKKKKACFRPGSNRGPCACEAHVITATLRKLRNFMLFPFKCHIGTYDIIMTVVVI